MLSALLIAAVLLPVAGAVLCGLVPARWTRPLAVVAALAAGLAAVAAAWAGFPAVFRVAYGGLPWLGPERGRALFGLLLDPLSTILLLVVTVIGFLTVLYSTSYLTQLNRDHAVGEESQGRYYFWLLAFLASMVGVAVAPNFLQLFIAWELTTVCSWALISFYRTERSLRAGFKAIVMTHAGGLFFLLAILILFAQTGSFGFDAPARLPPHLRGWVYGFLLVAAWAKAAQVPFHTWLPDAMEAPTPISAYLHAAAMVKAGVYLMARTVSTGWAMPSEVGMLMAVMALVTILVALSFYFVQDDLKRLLAYSTIAHLGYMLLGIALGALGSKLAFQGGALHLLMHSTAKATLFLSAGAVAYMTGSRSIRALGGLARVMPVTATAYFVGVLAVTGIPPFACFWSKFMILAGALQLPGLIGPIVLVLVLCESLIAFGWMLYVGQKVFFGAQTEVAMVRSDAPPAMTTTLVILILACLLVPLVGIPLVRMIGG